MRAAGVTEIVPEARRVGCVDDAGRFWQDDNLVLYPVDDVVCTHESRLKDLKTTDETAYRVGFAFRWLETHVPFCDDPLLGYRIVRTADVDRRVVEREERKTSHGNT